MSTPGQPRRGLGNHMPELILGQPMIDTRPWKPFSFSQKEKRKSKSKSKSRSRPKSKTRQGSQAAVSNTNEEPLETMCVQDETQGPERTATTNGKGDVPSIQQQRIDVEGTEGKRAGDLERSRRREREGSGERSCSSCAVM